MWNKHRARTHDVTYTHTHTRAETVKKSTLTKLSNVRNELKSLRNEFDDYKKRKQSEQRSARTDFQKRLDEARRTVTKTQTELVRTQERLRQAETELVAANEHVNSKRRGLLQQIQESNHEYGIHSHT